MKLSLSLQTSLQQTLTPQQIQYLKLLQLPILQFEQHIRQEIEENPMVEENNGEEEYSVDEQYAEYTKESQPEAPEKINPNTDDNNDNYENYENEQKENFSEYNDPFEFYEMAWQDNFQNDSGSRAADDDDEYYGFQIKESVSFFDEISEQFRMLNLTRLEYLIGEIIIGNLDDDGYLRMEMKDLIHEINDEIIELNQSVKSAHSAAARQLSDVDEDDFDNPARQYALSNMVQSSADLFKKKTTTPISENNGVLQLVKEAQVLQMLKRIQQLDPPGVGSRNIQECLLAQLQAMPSPSESQKNAYRVLSESYEAFTMKHYPAIMRNLGIAEDDLRDALEVIRKLNPKPGYGDALGMSSTVIPDFVVEYDEEADDIVISLNDGRIPELRVNKMYERLKRDARVNKFNKETRLWLRKKFDDAKFLLQAIQQRKITMLKVMTAIAGLQKDYFRIGPEGLKPLIYKDVADDSNLDVSTICRIVNGKFSQTPFGTVELRYFFSESLPSDDGEEISTRIVKQRIKELIEAEKKNKPLSDERITKELKNIGLNIARRTVAKYREQLRIPVARLRKEL